MFDTRGYMFFNVEKKEMHLARVARRVDGFNVD